MGYTCPVKFLTVTMVMIMTVMKTMTKWQQWFWWRYDCAGRGEGVRVGGLGSITSLLLALGHLTSLGCLFISEMEWSVISVLSFHEVMVSPDAVLTPFWFWTTSTMVCLYNTLAPQIPSQNYSQHTGIARLSSNAIISLESEWEQGILSRSSQWLVNLSN